MIIRIKDSNKDAYIYLFIYYLFRPMFSSID